MSRKPTDITQARTSRTHVGSLVRVPKWTSAHLAIVNIFLLFYSFSSPTVPRWHSLLGLLLCLTIIKSKRITKISVLSAAVIIWFKMTHGLMTSVTRIA
ncbi:unnamed protein product [Acanthoscelides obtectus]|uniref:Uncharacterized protein n=1 Tax=Acanthoscelides obtectus TaxID=200917 RepID=A0A9P0Q5L3_ACAOB|nr:unnamed protein product [Acanthoscelides obtectus]CAK1676071.1 hypothetical protein AOBTE_LOCUS30576 [Acanthoscelides obtectus]